mgnify:CR=1 FL=1
MAFTIVFSFKATWGLLVSLHEIASVRVVFEADGDDSAITVLGLVIRDLVVVPVLFEDLGNHLLVIP